MGWPATWHAVSAAGFTPWGRASACLVALPPPRPYLLVSGGGDADADFDDTYAFDLHRSYWERLSNVTSGVTAPAVTQAACVLLTGSATRTAPYLAIFALTWEQAKTSRSAKECAAAAGVHRIQDIHVVRARVR